MPLEIDGHLIPDYDSKRASKWSYGLPSSDPFGPTTVDDNSPPERTVTLKSVTNGLFELSAMEELEDFLDLDPGDGDRIIDIEDALGTVHSGLLESLKYSNVEGTSLFTGVVVSLRKS